MPNDQQQLITLDEAAERLHVHRITVHRLISDGRLPSLKVGRARRIRASDLDRFIEERLAAEVSS